MVRDAVQHPQLAAGTGSPLRCLTSEAAGPQDLQIIAYATQRGSLNTVLCFMLGAWATEITAKEGK
jgi:hypothetical protein